MIIPTTDHSDSVSFVYMKINSLIIKCISEAMVNELKILLHKTVQSQTY